MSRHISTGAVLAVAFFIAAAIVIFQVLNSAFGGPSPVRTGPSFEVTAPFADVQGLVTKSLVMVRGVPVGEVRSLRRVGDHMEVTIAVDQDKVTVHRDATMQVGRRTLFGEAYVRVAPGRPAAGRLASGARLSPSAVLPTVRLDDALKALGPRTRAHIRSLNRTASRVDEGGTARADLNATLGGLADTLEGLRKLTSELDGQENDLSRWVSSSRMVVDELGAREDRLRELVSAGRTSAEAATASVPALRETIAQTGGLLADTRATLRTVRPLLRRVRPVIERTSAAAPDTTRALRSLRPVARSAGTLVRSLPAFTAAARPVLQRLDQALARPHGDARRRRAGAAQRRTGRPQRRGVPPRAAGVLQHDDDHAHPDRRRPDAVSDTRGRTHGAPVLAPGRGRALRLAAVLRRFEGRVAAAIGDQDLDEPLPEARETVRTLGRLVRSSGARPAADALTASLPTRDPREDETDRVLDAAAALLAENGLRGVSMEAIARRAGISRATLFRRVPGRDALLQRLARRESDRLIARMEAASASSATLEDRLATGFVVFVHGVCNDRVLRRLIERDPDRMLPLLTTQGAGVLAIGADYAEGVLRRAQEEGAELTADPRQLAELMARIGHSLVLTRDTALPVDDEAQLLLLARSALVPMVLRSRS